MAPYEVYQRLEGTLKSTDYAPTDISRVAQSKRSFSISDQPLEMYDYGGKSIECPGWLENHRKTIGTKNRQDRMPDRE